MKRMLLTLAIVLGLVGSGWCYVEMVDVIPDTQTFKTVTINAGTWTIFFDSSTELNISTTTTANANLSYRMIYYDIRNDAGEDVDVYYTTDDLIVDETTCFNIMDTEVHRFYSKVSRWGQTEVSSSSPTVRVTIYYQRRR